MLANILEHVQHEPTLLANILEPVQHEPTLLANIFMYHRYAVEMRKQHSIVG